MTDARKLKEKATEAFAKGKFAKAAEAYADYCAADPKDLQARLRMGDAWVKAGQKDKAVGAYQFAAEGFAKEGFLPRAIAASKLILELDPTHKGVQKMLADLYARKSGPSSGRPKPPPARLGANKHAPSELPKAAADEVPLEIEESHSFKKRAATEEVVPIEVEKPSAPEPGIELDVSVTGAAVPPLPPPATPVEKPVEIEVEPPKPAPSAPMFDLEVVAEGEAPPPPPPPPLPAPEPPKPEGGTASGAYALDLDAEEAAPVQGVPEKSQLQIAEESGRFKRASSGAYELDLDDAPPEYETPPGELSIGPARPGETPIELTKAKPKVIDEAKLVAELAIPEPVAALVPSASSTASAPPGLKAKRTDPEASRPSDPQPPASSRIWVPNNGVEAPAEQSAARQLTAPLKGGPKTDLEKSLAAFSQFDDEIQIIEPPAEAVARAPHTFTELELEGDSLLHAVETAANIGLEQRGQAAPDVGAEERMEAPEEPKPEPGTLPKIPLFSDLPEDAFIALFERCPLKRFEPTEVVIQQGSLGDSFFVICGGSVKVYRNDGEVRRDIATLNEGAFFGEMALLSGAPRTASVEAASEDTQLLEISAPILAELSLKHPPVAQALKKFCRQRLLTNVMSSSALFAPFSRTERRQLVERFRARDVQKGDVLIKEGQRSDGMYVVLSGEIEVRLGLHPVASLKEGDIFGEMSLLTKAPATATCAAARRTSLLRLPREDFDQIVLSHPQILVLVSELTDERTKQNAAVASQSVKPSGDATPMV
ncbi:MAG: cyclic nucleotide-binding domain-containing protein [Myxococcaceae bacterium]|nr:cyclic nucleotide-binding domain-containing protein [Myxococcaceae bacterium]